MGLQHYSGKDYEVAAGAAAEDAKKRLKKIIEKGQVKATQTVQSITDEYNVRQDILAPASAIKYAVISRETGSDINASVGGHPVNFTNHSESQLLERIGLPRTFSNRLGTINKDWSRGLLLHNLRTLTDSNIADDRLLFRIVGDTAKGVLSSAYRRMDASPIFGAFIKEGLKAGLVPIDGVNSPSRYHVKMLIGKVYEPAPHEVVAFGMGLTTSDYGAGALQLQFFAMRLFCTNYMIGENCLKKVHLGKRFSGEGDDSIVLSQETYDLDTKTVASAVRDILHDGVDKKVDEVCSLIADADKQEIDVPKAIASYRKKGLLDKKDAEKAAVLFDTTEEITFLPKEKSAWRFSNVLSLMAQSADGDQKLALEQAAMAAIA